MPYKATCQVNPWRTTEIEAGTPGSNQRLQTRACDVMLTKLKLRSRSFETLKLRPPLSRNLFSTLRRLWGLISLFLSKLC